jgi:hypothetical protein
MLSTNLFRFLILAVGLSSALCLSAQPLVLWNYEGGNLSGTSFDPAALPNANAYGGGALNAGINASPSGGDGLQGSSFPTNSTLGGYYQAQAFCPAGNCDLQGFAALVESTAGGPTNVTLVYSIETGFANPVTLGTYPVAIGSQTSLDVPVFSPGCTRITLRMYPTDATFFLGSFYVDEFIVNGSVSAPLPVSLSQFSAQRRKDNSIHVAWKTASEINVDRFEVELSNDGKLFQSVKQTSSRGDEATEMSYSEFITSAPDAQYARLAMYDLDRSVEYSDVVSLAKASAKTDAVTLLANFGSQLFLQVNEPTEVAVFSMSGQEIMRQVLPEGQNLINDLSSHPAGTYLIRWEGGSQRFVYTQ